MGRPRRKLSEKPLDVQKLPEYTEFVRFSALPTVLREKEFGFATDAAFGEHYKVSKDTLVMWRGRTQFWNEVAKQMAIWGRAQTPDVMMGVLRKSVRDGTASEARLWLEFFEKLKEQGQMNDRDILKAIQDNTRALLKQESKKP